MAKIFKKGFRKIFLFPAFFGAMITNSQLPMKITSEMIVNPITIVYPFIWLFGGMIISIIILKVKCHE